MNGKNPPNIFISAQTADRSTAAIQYGPVVCNKFIQTFAGQLDKFHGSVNAANFPISAASNLLSKLNNFRII